jgi:hypothetical protein
MQAEQPAAKPQIDFWFDRWPLGLLLITVVVSVVTPVLSASWYGGSATWPSMITNFAATSIAFMIALAWDRRQRAQMELVEAEAEQRRAAADLRLEQERRETEATRRFSAIVLELERLQRSLQRTVEEQQRYKYFFPDLPAGSWRAGGGPLGMIISNYGLMADLSTFYGHVAELQWRLRFKAQAGVDEAAVNPIIDALASQMLGDVATLLGQVRKQVSRPDVTPVQGEGGGLVVARRQLTGAIRAVSFDREAPLADRR